MLMTRSKGPRCCPSIIRARAWWSIVRSSSIVNSGQYRYRLRIAIASIFAVFLWIMFTWSYVRHIPMLPRFMSKCRAGCGGRQVPSTTTSGPMVIALRTGLAPQDVRYPGTFPHGDIPSSALNTDWSTQIGIKGTHASSRGGPAKRFQRCMSSLQASTLQAIKRDLSECVADTVDGATVVACVHDDRLPDSDSSFEPRRRLWRQASIQNGYLPSYPEHHGFHMSLISVEERLTCLDRNNMLYTLTTMSPRSTAGLESVSNLTDVANLLTKLDNMLLIEESTTQSCGAAESDSATDEVKEAMTALRDRLRSGVGVPRFFGDTPDSIPMRGRPAPLRLWYDVLRDANYAPSGPPRPGQPLPVWIQALHTAWAHTVTDGGRIAPAGEGVVDVSVWGLDDGDTVYGWTDTCAPELIMRHADGLHLRRHAPWLWRKAVSLRVRSSYNQEGRGMAAGDQVGGARGAIAAEAVAPATRTGRRVTAPRWSSLPVLERPDAIITHSQAIVPLHLPLFLAHIGPREQLTGIQRVRRMQCALPVWEGEAYWLRRRRSMELTSDRTLFYHFPLLGKHWAHFIMNFLIPLETLSHELGGDRLRDRVAWPEDKGDPRNTVKFDFGMLADPGVRLNGANLDAHFRGVQWQLSPISYTCFDRTVIGAGGLCPVVYCPHRNSREQLRRVHTLVREYYSLPANTRESRPADSRATAHIPMPARSRLPGRASNLVSRRVPGHPLEVVVFQRYGIRAVQNIDQLWDIVKAFDGMHVTYKTMEGKHMARDNVEIFDNVDLLISPHGNAMTNLLWMPEDAYVIELQADYGTTRFFNDMAENWVHWRLLGCVPGDLGHRITKPELRNVLGSLQGQCPSLVLDVEIVAERLLEVQRKIDANEYKPFGPPATPGETASVYINRTPEKPGTCDLRHPDGLGGVRGGVEQYIYTPPLRFMRVLTEQLGALCNES